MKLRLPLAAAVALYSFADRYRIAQRSARIEKTPVGPRDNLNALLRRILYNLERFGDARGFDVMSDSAFILSSD
jgi:hypothetical protein